MWRDSRNILQLQAVASCVEVKNVAEKNARTRQRRKNEKFITLHDLTKVANRAILPCDTI